MKVNVLGAAAAVILGVATTSCGDTQTNVSLRSDVDSVSYAIGVNFGSGIHDQLKTLPGGESNVDALIAGFITSIRGDSAKVKMNPDEARQYMQTYFVQASAKEAKKNKEEGEKFLEENGQKKDVITTESGLQYQVIEEGTGERPTEKDRVKVHYTGTLLDGTEFDSSISRGEPAVFGVNQVIKGWTEGLQLMPVGSKYIFWIPANLAYGERSMPGSPIKANSMLKFEVELLEIVKQ